jgi:hypothetical protein
MTKLAGMFFSEKRGPRPGSKKTFAQRNHAGFNVDDLIDAP